MDYGKKVKRREVSGDFCHWLVRIVLDEGVYELDERALAFELAACESLLSAWDRLAQTSPAHLFVVLPVDRLTLYLHLLDERLDWHQRAAYWHLFTQQYGKHRSWIDEVRALRGAEEGYVASWGEGSVLSDFCAELRSALSPAGDHSGHAAGEIEILREEMQRSAEALKAMEGDVEFAEDRADRAHARIRKLDEEMQRLRRQLADERDNGEKLRSERRTRIASQRLSNEAQKELETLRREYARMDGRLKEMAGRLALAELRDPGRGRWDLANLRQLSDVELLGLSGMDADAEEAGKVRRRFANALHPDRVRDLPAWASALFAELMGVINDACDRRK